MGAVGDYGDPMFGQILPNATTPLPYATQPDFREGDMWIQQLPGTTASYPPPSGPGDIPVATSARPQITEAGGNGLNQFLDTGSVPGSRPQTMGTSDAVEKGGYYQTTPYVYTGWEGENFVPPPPTQGPWIPVDQYGWQTMPGSSLKQNIYTGNVVPVGTVTDASTVGTPYDTGRGGGGLGGLGRLISDIPIVGNITDEIDRGAYATLGKPLEAIGLIKDQEDWNEKSHIAGLIAATVGVGSLVAGGAGAGGAAVGEGAGAVGVGFDAAMEANALSAMAPGAYGAAPSIVPAVAAGAAGAGSSGAAAAGAAAGQAATAGVTGAGITGGNILAGTTAATGVASLAKTVGSTASPEVTDAAADVAAGYPGNAWDTGVTYPSGGTAIGSISDIANALRGASGIPGVSDIPGGDNLDLGSLPKSLTDTLISLGIPLTVAGLSSYLAGDQQNRALSESYDKQLAAANALYDKQLAASKEATLQSQEFWKQNAFMSQEAVDAYKKQGMSGLNATTETANRNFLDTSAARGFRGGGILTSGLADIERQRQKQYGTFQNNLIQYANTPRFSPNGSPYSVPSSSVPNALPSISGEQNLYNLLGGVGGTAAGLGLYKYLYGIDNP